MFHSPARLRALRNVHGLRYCWTISVVQRVCARTRTVEISAWPAYRNGIELNGGEGGGARASRPINRRENYRPEFGNTMFGRTFNVCLRLIWIAAGTFAKKPTRETHTTSVSGVIAHPPPSHPRRGDLFRPATIIFLPSVSLRQIFLRVYTCVSHRSN